MEKIALCVILNKNSNPLKGPLSYYNFYLNGELTNLMYKNIINLNELEKIVLYKNDKCKMFPEKFIFFINFSENSISDIIKKTLLKLKLEKWFIIRG